MQSRIRVQSHTVVGWRIHRANGWFVALPCAEGVHKVFEAPTMRALVHKIELWRRLTAGVTEHPTVH